VRVPTLKDRDLLLSHGADLAGHVALFPFSAGSDREWSLPHWLALETILHAAGIPTVVFDAGASPLAHFKGVRLHGQPAERVAGAILNCAAAVGNDSGLTHLSATLGTPTIALCGPTRGSAIFGGYPAASVLQAPLPCSGCYGRPPIHKGKHCQPHCPAMSAIRPEEVVRTIREVARNG
jgi:ADP-heptose:LPS heptosyltransferase